MVLTYHAPQTEPGLASILAPRTVHPVSLSLPPLSPIYSPRSGFPDPGAPNPVHPPSRTLPVYPPAKPALSPTLSVPPEGRGSPRTVTAASSPISPRASKYSSGGMSVPRHPVWDAPRYFGTDSGAAEAQ